MRYLFLAIVGVIFLSGCGAHPYNPMEYPLRDGLIQPFTYAGSVTVSNAQPVTEKLTVSSYMGTEFESNLNAITETMVQQTQKELEKNGKRTGEEGEKTVALKVNALQTAYSYMFYWESSIDFQAVLGDGQTLDFNVPHKSGDPIQDLNGCIAQGVMTMLNDERVVAYLTN